MQSSRKLLGVTAVVGAAAMLGTGVAAATPVKWEDCSTSLGMDAPQVPGGGVVECGTLEVPVDYSKPAGEKTTIALTRIKGTGKSTSTVFGNPGGPGDSALGYWVPGEGASTPAELYQNHDLVAVQPRGLYGSNPLLCNTATVRPASPNPMYDACSATNANYLASMTTENAARDMDAVRDSLGLATIDYVGQSYGTAIGADYLSLFPERAGKFVLDSNTNPDWRWAKQSEQTTLSQEQRINDIFAWIASRDDYYGLGDTPLKVFNSWKWITDQEVGGAPNLTPPNAEVRDLPVELRGSALEKPALDAINGSAPARARAEGFARAVTLQDAANTGTTGLFDATVGATASERAWPMLAHVLKYYNDGGQINRVTYPVAWKMIAAKESRQPAPRTDASLFVTVTCNENGSPVNPLGIAAAKADSLLGGNALATKAAAQAAGEGCVGWNPATQPVPTTAEGVAQKPLILNSDNDPITPIAGAQRMQELTGGTLVTVGGGTHGTFRSGNELVDQLVVRFLEGGAVQPQALPAGPAPVPLPKWDASDRANASDRGMSATRQGEYSAVPAEGAPVGAAVSADAAAPNAESAAPGATQSTAPAVAVPGADDWYGVNHDFGADLFGAIRNDVQARIDGAVAQVNALLAPAAPVAQ